MGSVKIKAPAKGEKAWPAEQPTRRKVSDLVPYARNSRTHSDAQVAQIAASIREWGWTNPILIDETGGIIAGHGRVLAARKLKIEEVPCIIATGWSEAQRRAYVLADNQLAVNAGWDMDLLKVELGELKGEGFDLGLIGFDGNFLDTLMADPGTDGLTDPDDVPEKPVHAVTTMGDVWQLGRHRLICGDCTDPTAWDRLKLGEDFVVFSSPPYNVGDASGLRDKYQRGVPKTAKFYGKYDDDKSASDYTSLIQTALSIRLERCGAVAFTLQPLANSKRPLLRWMSENADHLVDLITWDKGHAAPHIQKGIMASRFEWIILFSPDTNASRVIPYSSWQGKHSNVYVAPPQRDNEFAKQHGATFPVHLPEFVVGDLMNRCRGVVDCFMGTGTTIIAAEKLGRDGAGIELDPAYCDVTIMRWQKFTGQQAILESTGETFDSLKASRLVSLPA